MSWEVVLSERDANPINAGFGTFTGVFTPTLLTILGVIMYVRIGWVVGNAGLLGALAILALGLIITVCTGLSLSSIATNTRIGHGGPYAIMTRSLGLEAGGSIGIPLYLTRPLGVAMYIFGFREGVQWVVPGAPALIIDLLVFAVLFGIAFKSADLAFKTQYAIMAVIALSLLSIFFAGRDPGATHQVEWFGSYPGSVDNGFSGADFWMVFAVFFPATTGILAGANMSGDLADPRRSIPLGTLAAMGVAAAIYFGLAVWCAWAIPADELARNYNAVIDQSVFPPVVLAGLLGATASSALAGLVGGPRILMAMGENRIVPFADKMARIDAGEPRNAMLVTGVLTVACIMMRDLNAIAPLVTMFFLITYAMINVVVLLEEGLGLVSYRPTLRVPLWVPALGLAGCLFSMFIVNPTFSLVAILTVLMVYAWLHRRGLEDEDPVDVGSSIFVAMAEWAASRVTQRELYSMRSWKPNLLFPVEDVSTLRGTMPILADLASPVGSVRLLGLATMSSPEDLRRRLGRAVDAFGARGVQARSSVVALDEYRNAVAVGMMALQGAFFRPNLLFLPAPADESAAEDMRVLLVRARENAVGAIVYATSGDGSTRKRERVRVLIAPNPRFQVEDAFAKGNLNLSLLTAYRLGRVWRTEVELMMAVSKQQDVELASAMLHELVDLVRFPEESTRCTVVVGGLEEACSHGLRRSITIFGMPNNDPDVALMEKFVGLAGSTCLFVRDSGAESARA